MALGIHADRTAKPANRDGSSPGRLDRHERRELLTGARSIPFTIGTTTALLAIPDLYGRMAVKLTPQELKLLRMSYTGGAGIFIGAFMTRHVLPPLEARPFDR